jgi:hypothetical protein
MSVGEVISLYKDGELDIHPEFQRFFRWTSNQKSKLVESLLLGIPLPSLFVSQRPDGTWDVIDGLQRLSTILQLTGDLKDHEGNTVEPLVLEKTRYLPDLEGKRWDSPDDQDDELPQSAKLKIKRARLDLKIVLNTSDPSAKYELFQRLNTGGSLATDQEVRNCLLIMINPKFFDWLSALGQDENFKFAVPLSERALEERYDLELVVRFLVLRTLADDKLKQVGDLGPFLTDRIVEFAESKTYDPKQEERAFHRTFELLSSTLGDDAFKKYDQEKKRALGPLLISVYEVMALGIGFHAHKKTYKPSTAKIQDVHRSLWSKENFKASTGSGIRAAARIPVTVPLGRNLFGA